MEKRAVVREKMRGGEALQYNFKVERVGPGGRQGSAVAAPLSQAGRRGELTAPKKKKTKSFPSNEPVEKKLG